MARGCDCGRLVLHERWCASRLLPEPPKDRGPGIIPVESFKDAKARSQKGRAMQNVGKPLRKQPHQWDIPQGHECVKRGDRYVIQEAVQKPWEDDADFERRQQARHGQNI